MRAKNHDQKTRYLFKPDRSGDGWPLQADRMAIHSPLVECLRMMAGHYGRRVSTASLTAGLPIPPQGITPALFVRAAERADLNAKLADMSLEALAIAPNLPCILSLEHGRACILWEIKTRKNSDEQFFIVQFPETSDEKQPISYQKLKSIYTGYAFFLRPVARADDRSKGG